MSTHDLILDNQTFPAFRSDLNNALQALGTNSVSATAPSVTYPCQFWADTSAGLLRIRNTGNTAWIVIGSLADPNLGLATKADVSRYIGRFSLSRSLGVGPGDKVVAYDAVFGNIPTTESSRFNIPANGGGTYLVSGAVWLSNKGTTPMNIAISLVGALDGIRLAETIFAPGQITVLPGSQLVRVAANASLQLVINTFGSTNNYEIAGPTVFSIVRVADLI